MLHAVLYLTQQFFLIGLSKNRFQLSAKIEASNLTPLGQAPKINKSPDNKIRADVSLLTLSVEGLYPKDLKSVPKFALQSANTC